MFIIFAPWFETRPRFKVRKKTNMDANSRTKLLDADWRTLEVFPTKAARDRKFRELLEEPQTITD